VTGADELPERHRPRQRSAPDPEAGGAGGTKAGAALTICIIMRTAGTVVSTASVIEKGKLQLPFVLLGLHHQLTGEFRKSLAAGGKKFFKLVVEFSFNAEG
jgi:hypothetical protein